MKNANLTLILTLVFLITASGCSTYADATTKAITITESTASGEIAKVTTETAAATTSETAADTTEETATATAVETAGETGTDITTEATSAIPAVTALSVPATYASSFDTVRIYMDVSRTKVQSVLPKGGQITITGTAEKYGVTAEGFYVNLNLMTLVITATPTPDKPTTKPTRETDSETQAPVETEAPSAETAAPSWTAPAYVENCENIRNQIVQYCVDNGLWFPEAEVRGSDEIGLSLGYASSDNQYAESFINGKIPGDYGIQSVSCWIADGFIYISSTVCMLPVV